MNGKLYQCALLVQEALVANAPKDTWNLALNSIRLVQEDGEWYVLIGGEIAPYAEYTNEPWQHGKNPNEGWIEATLESVLPTIKQIMSGAISQVDLDEYKRTHIEKKLIADYKEHITEKERKLENI